MTSISMTFMAMSFASAIIYTNRRHLLMLLMLVSMIIAPSKQAGAENLCPWIAGWTGKFTLTGNGTGATATGITWTTNDKTATDNSVALTTVSGCSSSSPSYGWGGSNNDSTVSGSVNVSGFVTSDPCLTETVTGATGNGGASAEASAILNVDLSQGTYMFWGAPIINPVTLTSNACGTVTSEQTSWPLYPDFDINTFAPYPSFPLPTSPETLSQPATSSRPVTFEGLDTTTLPDTTSFNETLCPDPVWGIQVPIAISEALAQGNLTMQVGDTRATRLSTAEDPFTVNMQTDTETINGRTYRSSFARSALSWLNKSQVGLMVTTGLDSLERIASTQVAGLTATTFAYYSRGHLATITQGTRQTTLGYNPAAFLASTTDPLSLTTSYTYDTAGHVLSTTLPDRRIIGYSYDANGNLMSVTPPGKPAHHFTYTAIDLVSSYTPPAVSGTGATTYTYNLDRDPTMIIRSDGETIRYGYDIGGRLISVATPTRTSTYAYNSTTGNLATAAKGRQAA